MKLTQSHWRRCETHAGASLVAADADVVDRIALGQKPCRLRRQLYSITGCLLFASSSSASSLVSFQSSHVFLSFSPPFYLNLMSPVQIRPDRPQSELLKVKWSRPR